MQYVIYTVNATRKVYIKIYILVYTKFSFCPKVYMVLEYIV